MRDEDGKDPRCLSLQQIEYRRQTHAAARNSAGMRVQVFPVNLNTVGAGLCEVTTKDAEDAEVQSSPQNFPPVLLSSVVEFSRPAPSVTPVWTCTPSPVVRR